MYSAGIFLAMILINWKAGSFLPKFCSNGCLLSSIFVQTRLFISMASSTTNVQLELQPGRQKRQRTRKSPADKSKHRRSRKRVRVADATDEFYSVKSILDESSDKYLIDWEDDPGTGRTYSPTWVRLHCHLILTTARWLPLLLEFALTVVWIAGAQGKRKSHSDRALGEGQEKAGWWTSKTD